MSAIAHTPGARPLQRMRSHWLSIALAFGAVAAVYYAGIDAVCALLYDGYSYRDQTISELSAVGATTRPLWLGLSLVYTFLTLVCGAAIWAAANGRRSVQAIGAAVFAIGVISIVGWPFAPMHQREVLAASGDTFSDTMHLVLASVNSAIFFVIIALGIASFRGRFRGYSIATLLALLIFGAYTGMHASAVAANEATPWLGITERITVFSSMAWIGVFALLLRNERPDARS